MNRRFKFYFKNAFKRSVKATIANKGHLNYYFYMFLEFFARLSLVFAPLFDLTNVALAKNIKENGKIEPLKALSSSNGFKSFWAIFTANLLKGLLYLAGVVVLGCLTFGLGAIGLGIGSLIKDGSPSAVMVIFAIPGIIAIILYSIAFPIMFHPVGYIIQQDPSVGFGKAIAICYKAMKEKGFFTYFANLFIPTLLSGAIIFFVALFALVVVVISRYFTNPIFIIILFGLILLSILVYILPVFDLTSKVSCVWLLDDIIEFEQPAKQMVKGIYIRGFKGERVDVNNLKSNLIRLFDNTEDEINLIKEETKSANKEVTETIIDKEEITEVVTQEETETQIETTIEETQEQVVEEPQEETEVSQEKPVENETPLEETPINQNGEDNLEDEVVDEVQTEEPQEETEVSQEKPVEVVEEKPKKTRKTKSKKEDEVVEDVQNEEPVQEEVSTEDQTNEQ